MTPSSGLKVLIVDDSAIYRKLLSNAISMLPGGNVVDSAPNGQIALNKLAATPADLVLLDIFMPGMNGPEVLEEIRKKHPNTCVVMISGVTGRDADVTIKCLANGAMDFIAKPQELSYNQSMDALLGHLRRVLQLAKIRTAKPTAPPPPARHTAPVHLQAPAAPSSPGPRLVVRPPMRPELLLIGVSTGGPRALQEVIPNLPADFSAPILIVQHMPPMFTKSLAEQLDRISQLRVIEAEHATPIQKGTVYIAPGGRHLEIERSPTGYQTRLTDDPPVNSCRPSVDVLFRSVAKCRPRSCVCVILTGMGEDGANGVADLKAALNTSAWCLAQDAATSVVYGMPMAVAQRNLADEILPLGNIAPRLRTLFQGF